MFIALQSVFFPCKYRKTTVFTGKKAFIAFGSGWKEFASDKHCSLFCLFINNQYKFFIPWTTGQNVIRLCSHYIQTFVISTIVSPLQAFLA